MTKLEKVIKGLWCCNHAGNCSACPFDIKGGIKGSTCLQYLMEAAYDALKAQEPRLVTEADFEKADEYGFIPAWYEGLVNKEGWWNCIPKEALETAKEDGCRYWTSKPSLKQMEETPWQ